MKTCFLIAVKTTKLKLYIKMSLPHSILCSTVFTVERNILKEKFTIYAHFFKKTKLLIIARKNEGGGGVI